MIISHNEVRKRSDKQKREEKMGFITLIVGAVLINNVILNRFLGICPFLGVSKKLDTAYGMSMAVVFVLTLAATVTWLVETYLLIPLHLEFLRTIAFILVIAALVQLVEMAIGFLSPPLYAALGIYLPLITTNCAVLGMAIINSNARSGFAHSVAFAFFSAVGFGLALILFTGLRSRVDRAPIPAPLKGAPAALILAGIVSLAFMGFSGIG